jgi:cyanophycinase-like exopeptidase
VAEQAVTRSPAAICLIAGDPGSRGHGQDPLLASVLGRFGLDRPSVAYVGAASNDNRLFFMWIARLLKKSGAGAVSLVRLASRRADQEKARAALEQADIVFVSGGDVELGMRVAAERGMIEPLRALHLGGKPFIGMSAGSIMLAQRWVRWDDPEDDRTAAVFPCLGLAPLICDTHGEGEGWTELRVLLRLTGAAEGLGIPAGGALWVAADGSLAALGKPVQRIAPGAELPDLVP